VGIQAGEEFISVLILINMQHLLGKIKNPLFLSLPDSEVIFTNCSLIL